MEYYSFDRVLKELQMGEEELKRLVSEGEIRAFRDEDKMKFKKSDIEGLKKGRMTEPTIILPSGGSDGEEGEVDDESSEVLLVEDDTSETLLDIDELDDDSSSASSPGTGSSTSVPTVDFSAESDTASKEETGSETLTEELVFDDDSSSAVMEKDNKTEDIGSQETFVDDDTGMTTEPIELVDDDEKEPEATKAARPGPSRGAPQRRMVAMEAEAPGNPWMSAVLVVSAILLLFGGFLVISLIQEEDNPVTGWLTDIAVGMFPTSRLDDEGKWVMPRSEGDKNKARIWRQKVREGKMDYQQRSSETGGEPEGQPGGAGKQ